MKAIPSCWPPTVRPYCAVDFVDETGGVFIADSEQSRLQYNHKQLNLIVLVAKQISFLSAAMQKLDSSVPVDIPFMRQFLLFFESLRRAT